MTKWGSFQVCMSGSTFEVNQFDPSHQQLRKKNHRIVLIHTEKTFEKNPTTIHDKALSK